MPCFLPRSRAGQKVMMKAECLKGRGREHEMYLPRAGVQTAQSAVMCSSVKDRIVVGSAEPHNLLCLPLKKKG